MIRTILLMVAGLIPTASIVTTTHAAEPAEYQTVLQELAEYAPISTAIGVTRSGVAIPAFLSNGMLDVSNDRMRILVVSNLKPGSPVSGKLVSGWNDYCSSSLLNGNRPAVEFGIVPFANPDHLDNASADESKDRWDSGFPPTGPAYNSPENAERHYLWRWIGMLAPDMVMVVREGNVNTLVTGESLRSARLNINAGWKLLTAESGSLAHALTDGKAADVAGIPAIEFRSNGRASLFSEFAQLTGDIRSDARRELQRRKNRTPVEVATELAQVYGHQLNSVAYIPALALIGRARLAELANDDSHLESVLKIVEPYASGSRSTLGKRPSGSTLSGHLVFGELAKVTEDHRYTKLTQAAANLGFDSSGSLRESMPFHNEMSDAVFMGTPILVQAGRLTGDSRYFDMAARHLNFMLNLNLRKDGLHQHSPLDPEHTAWGRGNGFPALGLALALSDLPDNSSHRSAMLTAFREHLLAMIDHQDEMGMWHQIVDRPESYREFTVTCMTTFAITRGLRNKWLDRRTFEPVVQRAWESIKCRIEPDGQLVDVCTGTGKQKSRQAYYNRTAILGRDDRSGAMALMVCTELAFASREGTVALPVISGASR